MDILTQGMLGATMSLAVANPKETRVAAIIGFAAAALADADILIRSADDSLLNVEFHRHFSHALVFIPIGALLAAFILWPFLRRRIGFGKVYFYALMAYATSGLLDACTSYGTHLLWPFSDTRTSWSIIAIIDPVFSLLLLVATALGLTYCRPSMARIGLLLAGGYLLLGLFQHQSAREAALQLAAIRGHEVSRSLVKPTMANLLVWRSVYESEGIFHVDAVRVGLLGDARVYPGGSVAKFRVETEPFDLLENTQLREDMERFLYFSDGYVSEDPNRNNVLIDLRYSMLPNGLAPIWGLDANVSSPTEHARFTVYRDRPEDFKSQFMAMLLGRDLPD